MVLRTGGMILVVSHVVSIRQVNSLDVSVWPNRTDARCNNALLFTDLLLGGVPATGLFVQELVKPLLLCPYLLVGTDGCYQRSLSQVTPLRN